MILTVVLAQPSCPGIPEYPKAFNHATTDIVVNHFDHYSSQVVMCGYFSDASVFPRSVTTNDPFNLFSSATKLPFLFIVNSFTNALTYMNYAGSPT